MTEAQILDAMKWLARQNPEVQLTIWRQAYGDDQAEHERKKLAHAATIIRNKMLRDKRKYSDREQGSQNFKKPQSYGSRLCVSRKKAELDVKAD